jgi:hypothetical protein
VGFAGLGASQRRAIYYQDPDGRPLYSLTPRKTPDGRHYRAVPPSADLSFDDEPLAVPAATVAADRKIKFYRNPMGLPDTSSGAPIAGWRTCEGINLPKFPILCDDES